MTDVRMPDGQVVRFPDDMAHDQIKALIQTKYPDQMAAATIDEIQAAYDRRHARMTPNPGSAPLAANAGIGDVLGTAGSNLLPSAKRFGGDIVQAVTNPVETGKNLMKIAAGIGEKLIPGEQSHEVYADAVGKFFADRYGGVENIKKTMAEDPVGFLADLSTVLGVGGVVRAPGAAGQVSRVAGTVGKAIDPINAGIKAAKAAGKGVGNLAAGYGGLSSGAGGTALKTAAKAGFEGGEAAKTFRDNMRGNVALDDVIAEAKVGLAGIKRERQAAYNAGMADLSKDQTVLDFSKIDEALAATKPIKEFKGVSLEPSASKTAGDIAEVLDQWRKLPAADFHTAEGLDALKQRLGDLRNGVERGSASEKLVTQVYNIVKDQVVKQAPEYARTMENYSKASELIREIEGTLSLKPGARVDTQLRKLQSIMRNNVNTNYGKRADLVKLLEEKGAKNVITALAGQALNSIEPRGLARVLATTFGAGGAGAAMFMHPAALPLLGQLAASSPRLAGEAAYLGGRVTKGLSKVPAGLLLKAGYQSERDVPPWERIRLAR